MYCKYNTFYYLKKKKNLNETVVIKINLASQNCRLCFIIFILLNI